MKNNYILDMYKIAANQVDKPLSLPEMIIISTNKGYDTENLQFKNAVTRIFGEIFIIEYNESRGYNTTNEAKYTMTGEAFYRYLEYIEMQQAHKNSKQPTAIAIAAIAISVILGLVQIFSPQH